MIFELFSICGGAIKILLFKLIYFSRIQFLDIPKSNFNIRIIIKKNAKLILGKMIRFRNNVSFRIYNKGQVFIGNNCFFNDGCSINCQKEIRFGNNVICGQNVMFFDHDHDYKNNINDFITDKIIIGNNVWIGANCIILKGVNIGDNVVIAAGTIIKDDIKSNTMIYQKRENKIKLIER